MKQQQKWEQGNEQTTHEPATTMVLPLVKTLGVSADPERSSPAWYTGEREKPRVYL